MFCDACCPLGVKWRQDLRIFCEKCHHQLSWHLTELEETSKDEALFFPVLSLGFLLCSQVELLEIPCMLLACFFFNSSEVFSACNNLPTF